MTTMTQPLSTRLSSERGTALVLAMFMVLIVSAVGASLISFGISETTSTLNYKSMSQARYGAESGLHAAANYLLNTYVPPSSGVGAADPLNQYDMATPTNAAVTLTGTTTEVVFSSNTTLYPASVPPGVVAKQTAFDNAVQGWLEMGTGMGRGRVRYTARARLLSMFEQDDAYSGGKNVFQTWEITGIGTIEGAGAASIEVTAVIERRPQPAFSYAAFAKDNGCGALTFGGGGAGTGSYNSGALSGGLPVYQSYGGDVGSNGNLDLQGNKAAIQGTLSTPRTGVGNCTAGNVTALEGNVANVTGGIVELPQPIDLPTPDPVASPITSGFTHTCGGFGVGVCTLAGDTITLGPTAGTPVVQLGNVSLSGSQVLELKGGTYEINSITMAGNAVIRVVPGTGQVKVKLAGSGFGAGGEVFKVAGNGLDNPSYNPMDFQVVYGGNGDIKFAGNGAVSAVVYAPNAAARFVGNGVIYGSVMANTVTDMGNAQVVYDINLKKTAFTNGNPTMSRFTWSSFSALAATLPGRGRAQAPPGRAPTQTPTLPPEARSCVRLPAGAPTAFAARARTPGRPRRLPRGPGRRSLPNSAAASAASARRASTA
jgi:Tfp pilus assembly protein PilX